MYKNVTITLQKERDNPLRISFCFQTGAKIVIYVSTCGHWDCTTLRLRLRLCRSVICSPNLCFYYMNLFHQNSV